MKAIAIEDLTFGYGPVPLFEGFSLTVEAGEFLGIIGPNGSGKSTLLRLIAGVISPWHGRVISFGRDISRLSRREIARMMALVPQESFFAFEWTVAEVVMMGRNPFLGLFDQPGESDRVKVKEAMRLTDVLNLKEKTINAISAGEKQRVILARALAQEPMLLLLDEATAQLDLAHRWAVMRRLRELQNQGRTVIFVSHDLNETAAFCSRLLLLYRGRILSCDVPEKVVTRDVLKMAYEIEPVVVSHPGSGRPQVLLPPI